MKWRRRIDQRNGDMAHGITFIMNERRTPQTRGEAAIGKRKALLDGMVSLTLATDQYKYGDELIAQVYSQEAAVVHDRRADGWSRIQVYLGPADEDTLFMLEQLATDLRERLNVMKHGF